MTNETQDWSSSAEFEPGTVVEMSGEDGRIWLGVVLEHGQVAMMLDTLTETPDGLAWRRSSVPLTHFVFSEVPGATGHQGLLEYKLRVEVFDSGYVDAFMNYIQDNPGALKAALQNPDDRVFRAALERLKGLDKDLLESTLQDYANRWRESSRDDGFTEQQLLVYGAIDDQEWLKGALKTAVDEHEYAALLTRVDDVDWLMGLLDNEGLCDPLHEFDLAVANPHGSSWRDSPFLVRLYGLDPSTMDRVQEVDFLNPEHYLLDQARGIREHGL